VLGTQASRRRLGLDFPLLLLVLLLIGIGQLALHSASGDSGIWQLTQLGWLILGAVVAVLVATVDFRVYERQAYTAYVIVMAMLVLVLFVGVTKNSATRWLNLGVFEAQPSELMKVAIILVTARFLHERPVQGGRRLRELVVPFALAVASAILVGAQPDLGTALVIFFIFATVVLFEGVRKTSLILLIVIVVSLAVPFWQFGMKDYQRSRVTAFLNPDAALHKDAWQVRQAVTAVASGGWTGLGHGRGSQVQHGYVPENENDFIFAHVGEEYGFAGGILLIAVYAGLILWSLRIARYARDKFGVLLAVGIAALFFWHVAINIGMVLGLLPVVGLWLPFISLGGSSVLTVMICVGLLMNLSVRRHVFHA
jgi:rod shape determining protein RodA